MRWAEAVKARRTSKTDRAARMAEPRRATDKLHRKTVRQHENRTDCVDSGI